MTQLLTPSIGAGTRLAEMWMSLQKPMNLPGCLWLHVILSYGMDPSYLILMKTYITVWSFSLNWLMVAFHLPNVEQRIISWFVHTAHSIHMLKQKCPYNVTFKSLCVFRTNGPTKAYLGPSQKCLISPHQPRRWPVSHCWVRERGDGGDATPNPGPGPDPDVGGGENEGLVLYWGRKVAFNCLAPSHVISS